MLVKNNIAQPGEIKSVALEAHQVEVRLRSGEVMLYERKENGKRDQVQEVSGLHQEGLLQKSP